MIQSIAVTESGNVLPQRPLLFSVAFITIFKAAKMKGMYDLYAAYFSVNVRIKHRLCKKFHRFTGNCSFGAELGSGSANRLEIWQYNGLGFLNVEYRRFHTQNHWRVFSE
ncbi:protein of unknown function [Ruminococcaceae bacterium BL-4]|nr:protein of unknown function [Ruminococcaceae bacterium BL-4]